MPATDAVGRMHPRRGHMSKYRVLALDGGGIRGILTTILLQRLCNTQGSSTCSTESTLIAGNSSGALDCPLDGSRPLSTDHRRHGGVHSRGLRTRRKSLRTATTIRVLAMAEVRRRSAEIWLEEMYARQTHDARQSATSRPYSRIRSRQPEGRWADVAVKDRMWKPKLFHNFAGPNSDRDMLVWKVGLYSSSAPAYFPTAGGFSGWQSLREQPEHVRAGANLR